MEKRYQHELHEEKLYNLWEERGYFTPKIDKQKKPFVMILPLPNANDPMHMGHALFTIQDIMCRYHRMLGIPTLWLPGSDHAGTETQFVFEKKLAKEGKSRFDFDSQSLYQMIWDFVERNRKLNINQMKKLGFSLDWTRYHYSLEPEILEKVFATFRKLHKDKLIYRGEKIVNYCTHCGTAFSDLEVDHVERDDFLYYLDYGIIEIATTRPETIFADAAVAVHPKDKRYLKYVGKEATIPLINRKVKIITDEAIEIDFGTGALKVTPAHDQTDFEIGQRHGLSFFSSIDPSGKMINVPDEIKGLFAREARKVTVEMLEKAGKLIKVEPLHHVVGICYRCKNVIEPLLSPQWFIEILPLAKPAIEAVKKGETKFFPARFKKSYLDWMKSIRDWNISRQIVWGPRIPAWYCLDCNPDIKINFLDKSKKMVSLTYREIKDNYSFPEVKEGLQSLRAPISATYELNESLQCPKCKSKNILQETDTFDTWFLSGQWPVTTLGINVDNPAKSGADFKYFYPTTVLDTLWDILFFWVARMMMMGIYLSGKAPFGLVHLHSRVVDSRGQKMSKSKGNVIDPLTISEKYGADALRMALVYGNAPASDIVLDEKKVESMRNFANKVWNAARFIVSPADFNKEEEDFHLELPDDFKIDSRPETKNKDDLEIIKETEIIVKTVTIKIAKHYYGQALEDIYAFFWHNFCDKYLEKVKPRKKEALPTLLYVLGNCIKLLHPFAPFITESIYQELRYVIPAKAFFLEESLAISSWPGKK